MYDDDDEDAGTFLQLIHAAAPLPTLIHAVAHSLVPEDMPEYPHATKQRPLRGCRSALGLQRGQRRQRRSVRRSFLS